MFHLIFKFDDCDLSHHLACIPFVVASLVTTPLSSYGVGSDCDLVHPVHHTVNNSRSSFHLSSLMSSVCSSIHGLYPIPVPQDNPSDAPGTVPNLEPIPYTSAV